MNAIIGFTELADRYIDDKEALKRYHSKIKHAGDVLLRIINDILDLARIESGKTKLELTSTDLMFELDGLRDMFSESMKTAGIEFVTEVDIQDAFVLCDNLRLNQIVINLLSNAQKFTENGGKVVLRFAQTGEKTDDMAEYERTYRQTR